MREGIHNVRCVGDERRSIFWVPMSLGIRTKKLPSMQSKCAQYYGKTFIQEVWIFLCKRYHILYLLYIYLRRGSLPTMWQEYKKGREVSVLPCGKSTISKAESFHLLKGKQGEKFSSISLSSSVIALAASWRQPRPVNYHRTYSKTSLFVCLQSLSKIYLISLIKGALGIRRFVVFWNFIISFRDLIWYWSLNWILLFLPCSIGSLLAAWFGCCLWRNIRTFTHLPHGLFSPSDDLRRINNNLHKRDLKKKLSKRKYLKRGKLALNMESSV